MSRHWLLSILCLLLSCRLSFSEENSWGTKISFLTSDGIKLVGIYYPPKTNKNLTLILLHGLGSDKSEWQQFAKILADKGYGYCAVDARGHKESVTRKDGNKISYQEFQQTGSDSQWNKMIGDVGIVIKGLGDKYKIDSTRIGLVGASLGANVALNYAVLHPEVPLVVLLSPGLVYAGINTEEPIRKYINRSIAIAVSMWDNYAHQSSLRLKEIARNNKKAVLFVEPGPGHGVQMFGHGLETKLVDWIAKVGI